MATMSGKRVLLCGDHPWAGHTGVVTEEKSFALVVDLDSVAGQSVFAYPDQWRSI